VICSSLEEIINSYISVRNTHGEDEEKWRRILKKYVREKLYNLK
jgi:hypothetical protein